jgi:Polyketide cyclase / dehydrase and lipid transport
MRVEHDARFEVPVTTGFAFITDIDNWPKYWPDFVRTEPGSRWSGPGDEARIVVRFLGREVELRLRLTRIEADRVVEYESRQQGLPDARHERHFEAAGSGFRYRLVVEFEPRPGLRGVVDRILVRRGVERALRKTVENLQAPLG